MNYILETEHLSKQGGKAYRVKDLSMAVPEKCVYGFLGPNGAGKSTTLKMVLGLSHPDQGSIRIFGKTMNAANRLSILRQTGSLIENPGGYGHLTGLENMQVIQKLKGVKEEEIGPALKTVRLYEQRDKKCGAANCDLHKQHFWGGKNDRIKRQVVNQHHIPAVNTALCYHFYESGIPLIAASMMSASMTSFLFCSPIVRASVMTLSISRGIPLL